MRKICSILAICSISFLQISCSVKTGCDTPRQEALDPASSLHLLGNTETTWQTNPPTSGPHYPIPPKGGNYDYTLSNLEQVAFLESGGVIVQYNPNLKNFNRKQLSPFANESVLVAPNQTLESFLVATAWTWKLSCEGYYPEELEKFIYEYRGKVFGTHD